MLDRLVRSRQWQAAADAVEARLASITGRVPERLDEHALAEYRNKRPFVGGWRLEVTFLDGIMRRMDVAVGSFFPEISPRIVLVDHPPSLTWPHVESDGVLCLLPNEAECDPTDPAGVTINLLAKGCRLVEELIQGDIVARDFREEFLTYWAYDINFPHACLHSLLEVHGPTRAVRLFRGERFNVLAETDAALSAWTHNRFPTRGPVRLRTEGAAFLWLEEPLLPSAYPRSAADLRSLARECGDGAAEILDAIAAKLPNQIVTVLGAEGRHGPGLVAVTVPRPGLTSVGWRRRSDLLTRGFRPGKVPPTVAASRYFAEEPVLRSGIFRADPPWIHGRGQDPRSERLLASTVTVIGCGSVGAPVAVSLAQAGVGRLNFVDSDDLAWANVGRHPLGAGSVGKNKAVELAARLRADYPHLRIDGHNTLAQALVIDGEHIGDADLVVCATGSWAADSALDNWHISAGRSKPVVYAWTEAHACAGHAVAIAGTGGCLHCGIGRTGVPRFQITAWPDEGAGAKEEPACGVHYQPYGPVELGYINNMVAELAIDILLGRVGVSTHRVWCGRRSYMESVGGRWSKEWEPKARLYPEGGLIDEWPWHPDGCEYCRPAETT
ncbi:ThiF family adenylyltransferase [Microvirga calopogonii]|uniref:ThiF family adenylyltransferase n=1 Tax=Microvirga calopogonii TaxID=2078013 RepID=UPI000E0CF054|nr:ThiF family adenylyltransferase [Microvirga calopogonii]